MLLIENMSLLKERLQIYLAKDVTVTKKWSDTSHQVSGIKHCEMFNIFGDF